MQPTKVLMTKYKQYRLQICSFIFFVKKPGCRGFCLTETQCPASLLICFKATNTNSSVPGFLSSFRALICTVCGVCTREQGQKQLGCSSSCQCAWSLFLISCHCTKSVSNPNSADGRSLNLLTKYVTRVNKMHEYSAGYFNCGLLRTAS